MAEAIGIVIFKLFLFFACYIYMLRVQLNRQSIILKEKNILCSE